MLVLRIGPEILFLHFELTLKWKVPKQIDFDYSVKMKNKWASENIYFLIFSHFDFLQFCPTVLRQCKTIVKFHFTLSVFRVFCCFMRARTELFTVYYYYYYHCYLLLLILLLLLLLRGFSLCVLFIYFAWQQMHYKA